MRACKYCGGPVASVHGIPSCKSCQRERSNRQQRAKYRQKRKLKDGVRRCKRCRLWRSTPSQIRPQGWVCIACQRSVANKARNRRKRHWTAEQWARERERMRDNRRRQRGTVEGRARHRERNRAWRAANPGASYEAHKRWLAKIKRDPKRWEQYKEDTRMYHRLYRERKGGKLREVKPEVYANGNGAAPYENGRAKLPAGELAPFILAWLGSMEDRRHGNPWTGRTIAGVEDLASLSDVSARRISSILHGEQEMIHRDTADKLCTALAVPMAFVYPDDRESA